MNALLILMAVVSISGCKNNSVDSSDPEDDTYQDILTPEYYKSGNNDAFKIEVNAFLEHVITDIRMREMKNTMAQKRQNVQNRQPVRGLMAIGIRM